MLRSLIFLITIFSIGIPLQAIAKEKLVLMPLRLQQDDKSLQTAMEAALVEGLQKKYTVFAGDRVQEKVRDVFSRESAKEVCDEARCLQDIAMAFQAERIAVVTITRRKQGYFLAVNINNVISRNVDQARSVTCNNCDNYAVIDILKMLADESAEIKLPQASQQAEVFSPPQATKNNIVEQIEMSEEDKKIATAYGLVAIPGQPWKMMQHEVTFAQWQQCTPCRKNPDDRGWGRNKRPVIYVSHDDIAIYINWLNKQTGKNFRLPTEDEWEYAARGGTDTDYWWGNDIGVNNANCNGCGSRWDNMQTAPVGSFKPNPYGLYDTVGNVWEWTSTCMEANCEQRVLRGGGSHYKPEQSRVTARRAENAKSMRYSNFGFRLVLDP